MGRGGSDEEVVGVMMGFGGGEMFRVLDLRQDLGARVGGGLVFLGWARFDEDMVKFD